jgi:hypothetical protein
MVKAVPRQASATGNRSPGDPVSDTTSFAIAT